ncbi:DUF192 domain-containing protein [Derxia lacustris]|uniref:DUF192 domain-containing protein n=1 Tax=Derxia lacustris TaxID=764842 RepID=UPI000A1754C0|nr:DUF192 domain-containing protein [Derxia lacustris]
MHQRQSGRKKSGFVQFARGMVAALMLATAPALLAQAPAPTVELSSGVHLIHAELAATPADRQRGLMFREVLGPSAGMLFVFDEPAQQCMWMRNTLIALAVAFIDDDGKIVNVEEMAPKTDDTHCSARPVRYALEMNGGWFARRGMRAGTTISGIAKPR